MHQQGYLTTAQYHAGPAAAAGAGERPARPAAARRSCTPTQATAPPYPDFVDYVTRWLLAHFPASEVYGGGLRVQTTLDPTVQAAAYAAVRLHPVRHQRPSRHGPGHRRAQHRVRARPGRRARLRHRPPQVNLALGGCDPPPGKGASGRRWPPPAGRARPSPAAARAASRARRGSRSRWPPRSSRASSPTAVYYGARRLPDPGLQGPRRPAAPAPARSTTTSPAASSAPRPSPRRRRSRPTPSTPRWRPRSAATTWPPRPRSSGSSRPTTRPRRSTTARATPSARSTCRRWTWRPPTACSPTTASGPRPTPILEIVNSTGKVLVNNISPLPPTTTVLPANVADNVTNVLQGVITGGTGTAAQLGPARGRQDRDDQQLHQRLVRRLHPDPVDGGVDGQRRQPGHPDGRSEGRRPGLRRDVAGDHLAGAS